MRAFILEFWWLALAVVFMAGVLAAFALIAKRLP